MRSGRHGSVALLLSTVRSRSLIAPAVLDGILAALMPHNLHLTLSPVPDERLVDPDHAPKMLRTWSCDGVLINCNAQIPSRRHPPVVLPLIQPPDAAFAPLGRAPAVRRRAQGAGRPDDHTLAQPPKRRKSP